MDFFARYAEKAIDNGFRSVVAVLPAQKRPRFKNWQTACFKPTDQKFLAWHIRKHPNDSVGIACGFDVVAIDIDIADVHVSWQVRQSAADIFGSTPLMRVGRWPKLLLVFRAGEPIDTQRIGGVDILGRGSQFVAFGIHPGTGKAYYWLEDSPSDIDVSSVPEVSLKQIKLFVNEVYGFIGAAASTSTVVANNDNSLAPIKAGLARSISADESGIKARIVRDDNGRVVDGREAFLTLLVYKYFKRGFTAPDELAKIVWQEFCVEVDLSRPKGDGSKRWAFKDAHKKAIALRRKNGAPRQTKTSRGRHPASHLHSHRRSGYWTPERKKEHQAEASRRTITLSRLAVNQAMLDMMPIAAGQCTAVVRQLAESTGLATSTVKEARAELMAVGLWIAERGIYVPIPLAQSKSSQVIASTKQTVTGVQIVSDPLYRSLSLSAEVEGSRPAFNDNQKPEGAGRALSNLLSNTKTMETPGGHLARKR